MIDFKQKDLVIPFGLCEITYGDIVLPAMGSEGVFTAKPTYRKLYGGAANTVQKYILETYEVTFDVSFNHLDAEILRLYMPTLQQQPNVDGLNDSPHSFDLSTNLLTIHPYDAGNNRDYDINIFNAFIDPETEFSRIFGKQVGSFPMKFIGTPANNATMTTNSYFYIGDVSMIGGGS